MRRVDREITDTKELIEIIEKSKVCHVAMIDGDFPYMVPLSFGYEMTEEGLVLYFHSAKEGKKLDIIRKNSNVCFTISTQEKLIINDDIPCSSGCTYASVIGMGTAEILESAEEKCHALSVLMKHQAGKTFIFDEKQAEMVCVFKISVKEFTGKRKKG